MTGVDGPQSFVNWGTMVQIFLLGFGNRAVRASVCLHCLSTYVIAKYTKKTCIALIHEQNMRTLECRRFFLLVRICACVVRVAGVLNIGYVILIIYTYR